MQEELRSFSESDAECFEYFDEDLIKDLHSQGYYNFKVFTFRDKIILCALFRFIFTTGLVIDLDEDGYYGRYCFNNHADALDVINSVTKIPSELSELPGEWIKFKGKIEFAKPSKTN